MTVYLGADHRGFQLKSELLEWLTQAGFAVIDCGNIAHDTRDDYPEFALAVGKAVAKEPQARGIVLCGTGVGVMIAANKVPGVRAAMAWRPEVAQQARTDDDVNVLALAANFLTIEEAKPLVEAFLHTDFSQAERFTRRLQQITKYEQEVARGNGHS